jgi:hypothetical protein
LIGVVTSNPCKKDTDADGLSDGREVLGKYVDQVVQRKPAHGGAYTIGLRRMNPRLADTDRDGLSDKQEVSGSVKPSKSDPTAADTDWGNWTDAADAYPAIYGK